MGRATHSSRGRPAGQANGASRLRRALDSPHSCRLAPSIRDAAEIPVQEISQPDARAPGLAEVQATSLEDREVEHRDETADRAVQLHDLLKKSPAPRSEEHTSELQSRLHLVCRLLLEK